jgi:hypothetical protein
MSRVPERFALVGPRSGELLTYRMQIIVHDNRAEMEFLFPKNRVVRLSMGDLKQGTIRLKDHPGMAKVRFPLRREDFPDG